MHKRVVISGIGVVSSIGSGKTSFLSALKEGKNGIQYIPELAAKGFGCCIGGVPTVESHPLFKYLSDYNLQDAPSNIAYAVLSGLEAWLDAGLNIPSFDSEQADFDSGVFMGSVAGNIELIANTVIPFINNGDVRKLGSKTMEYFQLHSSAAFLSQILALGNITSVNSSACASSTESIYNAYERIKYGKAQRMLAGGSDAYSHYIWGVVDAARMTTRKFNKSPEKASRPMSATASGFVPAAGSGFLLLEDMESAIERGAKIYAEIIGGHLNSGGQRNGGNMTAPNPIGVQLCIEEAIKDANIKSSEIDLIAGHLTSTMADVIEVMCWSGALKRKQKDFAYINSLKSIAGHHLGAAGAIETIAAALQLKEQFIHPSLNCEDLHLIIEKNIGTDNIPHKTINNIDLKYIAKANFGTGDTNACIILKKFENK